MSKTYTPLHFYVSPEFKEAFREEARRLGMGERAGSELLRRMFKTWQTVTAEEEKRKKTAVIIPGDPKYGT